ncbi:hypothetical protein D9M72_606090 [compost metagenome]
MARLNDGSSCPQRCRLDVGRTVAVTDLNRGSKRACRNSLEVEGLVVVADLNNAGCGSDRRDVDFTERIGKRGRCRLGRLGLAMGDLLRAEQP